MPDTDITEMPWEINETGFPRDSASSQQLRFLLRYAILAPSTRNTQPWKFHVTDQGVDIYTDRDHWLKVADTDQRELSISIGCAFENLRIAMRHFGLGYQVVYHPGPGRPDLAVQVRLTPSPVTVPYLDEPLFYAIIDHQSNHFGFRPAPINEATRQRLQSYCVENGLSLYLTDDPAIKQEIDERSEEGDAMQFADPAFMREFQHDLESGAVGIPWVIAKLHRLAVAYLNPSNPFAQSDAQHLTNAPLLCLVASEADTPTARIQAGQVFERLWLAASSMQISMQPMTQALQLPQLLQELARITGLGNRFPQEFFRLGYAEQMEGIYPHRRPLEEVLLES